MPCFANPGLRADHDWDFADVQPDANSFSDRQPLAFAQSFAHAGAAHGGVFAGCC